ncbi:MAG: glycerol kinase GlpK [Planctomycetes bacterium]|nr:glycerol kinase GlpK [Planctomycetota bacterium]
MSFVLAIDQSTSGTKAVLFDRAGRVHDLEARGHEQHYPQPGWVEHDAEEIWHNTVAVVREVLRRASGEAKAPAFLSLTNQRETFVVFDRATGRPLYHAIVWQCRRGHSLCRQLTAAGQEALIRRRTGLKIDSYFSASKLTWLVRERPDLATRLASGDALIGTIDTYLIYRLTGGKVFATDPTNASRTLLFDNQRLRWDEELCRLFEVPRRALPEVRESGASFGTTDLAGAFSQPVPIRGVLGDSQAALFAQGCFQPGMIKATFGSGTSVLLNIGDFFRLTEGGAVTALAWVLDGRPTYALEGLINCSGATVSWLKDQLGLIREAAETEDLARSVADNGGVYLVPAFAGLGAPYWKPDAGAAILGMTAHTTRAHVVRAALESIAYQVRDVLEMMASVGVAPRTILADGGATRNPFLMQTVADICGLEVDASNVPELSALGASWFGMLGAGWQPSLEALAALPRDRRHYRPQMDPARAERLHAGWKQAVQRVL